MSIPNDQMEELRKKAFYDSHISLQNNIKKHKNTTDPILQEKDNYVSNNIYNHNLENKRSKDSY